MKTREIAKTLGVSERVIQKHAQALGYTKNGIETDLDEVQATEIKARLFNSNPARSYEVAQKTTRAEMIQKTAEVMSWLSSELESEKSKRIEAERKNAVLMHVTKTYTATEIAKELGLRSAQELNEVLQEKGIQFKQNGTWVPYADYSEQGYFEIKQIILDNGIVKYDRRITQDGRRFILDLLELRQNGEVEQ
jgi:phage antirepressor YoqD-like protein